MDQPIRVVSVSLGSSRRDKKVATEFLGHQVVVERRGTDGDAEQARQLIAELDGQVAAIGLGGIDLYLMAGGRRYVLKDALRLAQAAKTTPVVDGSGLKNTLERQTIRYLSEHGLIAPADGSARLPRCLLVSAVDRFGMAEACDEFPCEHVFGDLIFALKIPIPVRSLGAIRVIARMLLPIVSRLPFEVFYPTGEKQREHHARGQKWFRWADMIGGDYHFIGTNLPAPRAEDPQPLAGKLVVTNTTTDEDVQRLRELGLARLVTTTPRLDGRSFGTNVMEGVLVALSGKRPEELTEADYLDLLARLNWEPQVDLLQG
jgi:hypothetical protein